MSGHRRISQHRDANEAEIFSALAQAGYSILRLHMAGGPDAVIFHPNGRTFWLIEVKARLGKLTSVQVKFRLTWRGPPIHIVRSSVEALALVTGRPVPQD